jgi:hypothetical protein
MRPNKPSPEAARELEAAVPNNGDWDLDHPLALETDCPHGCSVEDAAQPCRHGWLSAARTLGWV